MDIQKRDSLLLIGRLYAAFFIAWIILRFLVQDAIWWVALLNTYPFLATFPALMLVIVLFWRGHKRLAGLFMALIVLLFGVNYGALFWPNGGNETAVSPTFTAMTYNIKFDNEDEEAMLEAIRQADADIVGLQEVTLRHTTLLEEELFDQYPYLVFAPPEFMTDVAILSKYPVVEVSQFVLQPRRMTILVKLEVGERPLNLIVSHLTPTQLGSLEGEPPHARIRERFSIRTVEVTGLILALQNLEGPTLLLCDCNFAETSQAYRNLSAHFKDVHREIGWGFGKTNYLLGLPFPAQRVDYVWYTDGLRPTAVRFGDPGESDHRPLIATFAFAPSP